MNIDKYKKGISIKFIISVIIVSIIILLNIYLNSIVNYKIPDALVYKSIDSSKVGDITFNDINNLKVSFNELQITGYHEIPAQLTNKFGASVNKVKLVLTDENFPKIYPLNISVGSFFFSSSVRKGSDAMVISEGVANNLFKSINVIGNVIYISGKSYNVVGVYKEDKTLLYEISMDGYERVYIPYSSWEGEQKSTDVLAIKKYMNFDAQVIHNNLNSIVGDKIYAYTSADYSVSKKMLFQMEDIFFYILGILLIISLLKIIKKTIENLLLFLKEKTSKLYITEVIKLEKKKICKIIAQMFICIALIFIIFNSIKFDLIIPDKYIPENNIFDINFYKEIIISNIQANNGGLNSINIVEGRYISNVMKIEMVTSFCQLITLAILMISAKMFVRIEVKPKRILKYPTIFLLLLLLILLGSYIFGVSYLRPVKYFIIFDLFILGYISSCNSDDGGRIV